MVSAGEPFGRDGDTRPPVFEDLEGCLLRLSHRLFPPSFLLRALRASRATRFGGVKGPLLTSLPAHAVSSGVEDRRHHSIKDKRLIKHTVTHKQLKRYQEAQRSPLKASVPAFL
jgi:hypothetical protein